MVVRESFLGQAAVLLTGGDLVWDEIAEGFRLVAHYSPAGNRARTVCERAALDGFSVGKERKRSLAAPFTIPRRDPRPRRAAARPAEGRDRRRRRPPASALEDRDLGGDGDDPHLRRHRRVAGTGGKSTTQRGGAAARARRRAEQDRNRAPARGGRTARPRGNQAEGGRAGGRRGTGRPNRGRAPAPPRGRAAPDRRIPAARHAGGSRRPRNVERDHQEPARRRGGAAIAERRRHRSAHAESGRAPRIRLRDRGEIFGMAVSPDGNGSPSAHKGNPPSRTCCASSMSRPPNRWTR